MSTKPAPAESPGNTPMERMADFTRRIIAVPRSEVVKPKAKPKKRKRR